MDEVWKDIVGYEDYYQISNLGRFKRKSSIKAGGAFYKEKILKINGKNSRGYITVRLNGGAFTAHRLIAIHFIERVAGKDFVNHINGIKHDNRIENLEWCTLSENSRHAFDVLKIKRRCSSGLTQHLSKVVLDAGTGVYYYSITEAAYYNGIKLSCLKTWLNGVNPNKSNLILA